MKLEITSDRRRLSPRGRARHGDRGRPERASSETEGRGDPVVLDFEGTFMDSSGLRVLLEAASAEDAGTSVAIIHPTEQVRRVLDISIPEAPGLEVRS